MLKAIFATAVVLGLLSGCSAPSTDSPYQAWIEKQAQGKVRTLLSGTLPMPGMYHPKLDDLK